jgi:hypothetical protein
MIALATGESYRGVSPFRTQHTPNKDICDSPTPASD